jgi:xanthine dehydrogenase molybdopterin-binding subunit B
MVAGQSELAIRPAHVDAPRPLQRQQMVEQVLDGRPILAIVRALDRTGGTRGGAEIEATTSPCYFALAADDRAPLV